MATQALDMSLFLASVAEACMNPEATTRILLTEAGVQLATAAYLKKDGYIIRGLTVSAANLFVMGMASEALISGEVTSSFYLLMGNVALNTINTVMALWTSAGDEDTKQDNQDGNSSKKTLP